MKTYSLLRWSVVFLMMTTAIVMAQDQMLITVDEPAVCLECHANIEIELTANHLHTAFGDGLCSDCHNPHASKHAKLLTETTGELCLTCHEEIEEKSHKKVIHPPVLQGDCQDCHKAHASAYPNQLTGEKISVCSTCHNQVLSWSKKAVVHKPIADGDCSVCHETHGASVEGLLAKDVPALCLECHEPDAQFNSLHESDNIQFSDCRTCHDPHATSTKGLLRSKQHAPFASGNCKVCHDQDADNAFAVKNTPERLCKMCHKDVGKTEEATSTMYRHSETRENYCIDCHNPHTSDVDNILISSQETLCVSCHFNDDDHPKKPQEYLTHKGQDCSICHSLHVADNKSLLKTVEIELCSTCHTRAHSVTHPIGEDVIDPRDNKPMTCLDCHQMHGADYNSYLPLDPKMALCIQCHKR